MKEKRNDLVKSNSIVYSNNNILHSISNCNINDMGNSRINKANKEVYDVVNGMEVLYIYKPRDLWEPIEIRVDSRYTNFILAEDIKTILTKESYMANCYKIRGKKEI